MSVKLFSGNKLSNNTFKYTVPEPVEKYIYYYGNISEDVGYWAWTYAQNGSTNSFSVNVNSNPFTSNNLYIQVTGSGTTSAGIWTRIWSASAISIPSSHNKMDVYYYVIVKDSNSSDTGGTIEFGLGTGSDDYSKGYYNANSQIGSTDGAYFTSTVDISAASGGSYYFNTKGSGGQYANVQYRIYSIRTYKG